MTSEIVSASRDLFRFLEQAGVPDRTIQSGEDQGIWIPLAKTLRACQYRAPRGQVDPLDFIVTRKRVLNFRGISSTQHPGTPSNGNITATTPADNSL